MATRTRFGRLKEKAPKEKALDFREGAKLPWPGVILVLLGIAGFAAGGLFLLIEMGRPTLLVWNTVASVAGVVAGLGLILFSFIRWANL